MLDLRQCEGCEATLTPGSRERNKRRWCSERCRVRAYYARLPAKAAERNERNAERSRRNYVPVRHANNCAVCGAAFTAKQPRTRYCSPACRYRQHYLDRRARRRGALREPFTVMEIGARDAWRCGICLADVDPALRYPDPRASSLDHVIPLSEGGNHTRANVQISHLGCNWRKGNRAA